MKKYLYLLAALLPVGVMAQGIKSADGNLGKVVGGAGLTDKGDLADVIGSVINVALSLVGLTFLVLMVYGGYLWLTSRGDEAQIEKSKEIIKSAIIGLVLVMSAYAITVLVTSRFET